MAQSDIVAAVTPVATVIEFYNTPSEAEAMLARVLRDEPDWRDVFYVEPIELVTGGLN